MWLYDYDLNLLEPIDVIPRAACSTARCPCFVPRDEGELDTGDNRNIGGMMR